MTAKVTSINKRKPAESNDSSTRLPMFPMLPGLVPIWACSVCTLGASRVYTELAGFNTQLVQGSFQLVQAFFSPISIRTKTKPTG